MMRLITAVGPGTLGESLRGDYEALQRVLEQKIAGSGVMVAPSEEKKGLLVESADLDQWKSDITALLKKGI